VSRLGELTTTDVGKAAAPILLVPIGSCEQHGPHLPLDTDTRIAVAVCDRVVARLRGVFVGPAVGVGASGEHAGFPGTLSIGTEALTELIVELVRSADRFHGVLLVNGHGGNATALTAAAARCESEGRRLSVHHITFPGGDAHAGRTETSIMLALSPELVRRERAVTGETTPVGQLMPRLRRDGVSAVSPSGILGDPTGASAEEGQSLLGRAADEAVAATGLLAASE
jgi:mycofactocin system creatininase family protein